MAETYERMVWDLSNPSELIWSCPIDGVDPVKARLRIPNCFCLHYVRKTYIILWLTNPPGQQVKIERDEISRYFGKGWADCVTAFGLNSGMVIQLAPHSEYPPGNFSITVLPRNFHYRRIREDVNGTRRNIDSSTKSKAVDPGDVFHVQMTKSYVSKRNATVTLPAGYRWWKKWEGIKTHEVFLTTGNCTQAVSVHCYNNGASTKIGKGWNKFVERCSIMEGDIVSFSLVSASPIEFKVEIYSCS